MDQGSYTAQGDWQRAWDHATVLGANTTIFPQTCPLFLPLKLPSALQLLPYSSLTHAVTYNLSDEPRLSGYHTPTRPTQQYDTLTNTYIVLALSYVIDPRVNHLQKCVQFIAHHIYAENMEQCLMRTESC